MNGKKAIIGIVLLVNCMMLISGCTSDKEKGEATVQKEDNYAENIYDIETGNNGKFGSCYEVFIYSFCDSNGDGIGDINGLISKLDYIQNMGFDSIWLMPFNSSTTYHKYDVTDYYGIEDEYGTMEDFEKLIAECDKRNIKIYMDLVINHTSSKHPWFKKASEYVSGLGENEEIDTTVCPEAGYYNFVKSESCPNGYNKVSGTTNWYYECVFWSEMPDLNLDNDEVRENIKDIACFWINKGVKGFRMDAALHYYDDSMEKSVEFLKWFCDYVRSVDEDIYVIAEVWDSFNTRMDFYKSNVDSLFDFSLGNSNGLFVKSINRKGNGKTGKELAENEILIEEKINEVNKNAVNGIFIANHDTGRTAGFLSKDEDKIKLAAGLMMMSRGCVYVYYGEELGMSGSGIDENKRAPMYWTDDDSSTEMTKGPANMEKQEHKFGSLETQQSDSSSIYNYYRKALYLRNKYKVIGSGSISEIEEVSNENGNIYAVKRFDENEEIYVLFNISDEPAEVSLSGELLNKQIGDSLCVGEERPEAENDILKMPAYSGVILK